MATSKAHHEAETSAIDETIEKVTTIYPRGLSIVWGNDNRYWRLPEKKDPNNSSPAELIQVSWLEVTGQLANLLPGKKYRIQFYLSLKSDAFGWNGCQVYLMAKIGKRGKYKWTKIVLKDQTTTSAGDNSTGISFPAEGFVIDGPSSTSTDSEGTKLFFGLYEVWSGKWKGGLQIHKAVVSEV